jgi:hypothetical protein
VKYVVHSSKRKNRKKYYFSSHKLPKQQSTNFWSQGILEIKSPLLNSQFNNFEFEFLHKTNDFELISISHEQKRSHHE